MRAVRAIRKIGSTTYQEQPRPFSICIYQLKAQRHKQLVAYEPKTLSGL